MRFIDALFTATSATCVTGLVVVDTGTHFTVFGQVIILCLIQVGGLGFMTMATWFAFVLKKKISLKERLILQEALNQGQMEGIVRLIRNADRSSYFTSLTSYVGDPIINFVSMFLIISGGIGFCIRNRGFDDGDHHSSYRYKKVADCVNDVYWTIRSTDTR